MRLFLEFKYFIGENTVSHVFNTWWDETRECVIVVDSEGCECKDFFPYPVEKNLSDVNWPLDFKSWAIKKFVDKQIHLRKCEQNDRFDSSGNYILKDAEEVKISRKIKNINF